MALPKLTKAQQAYQNDLRKLIKAIKYRESKYLGAYKLELKQPFPKEATGAQLREQHKRLKKTLPTASRDHVLTNSLLARTTQDKLIEFKKVKRASDTADKIYNAQKREKREIEKSYPDEVKSGELRIPPPIRTEIYAASEKSLEKLMTHLEPHSKDYKRCRGGYTAQDKRFVDNYLQTVAHYDEPYRTIIMLAVDKMGPKQASMAMQAFLYVNRNDPSFSMITFWDSDGTDISNRPAKMKRTMELFGINTNTADKYANFLDNGDRDVGPASEIENYFNANRTPL